MKLNDAEQSAELYTEVFYSRYRIPIMHFISEDLKVLFL